MEFTNEFTVPLGIDEAFEVLTDLERVAPCMPGATLEEVDGQTYSGRVKVKVGPMSLTYSGSATVTEKDPQAHTARIEASGREKRGAGTASADVAATLVESGGQTVVTVVTDLNVTGKPAQFGRGVMADVGEKIIDRFAANLHDELDQEEESPPPIPGAATPVAEPEDPKVADLGASGNGSPSTSSTARRVEHRAPRDEALDLVDVAGGATARRLAPVIAAIAGLVGLVLWRRRR